MTLTEENNLTREQLLEMLHEAWDRIEHMQAEEDSYKDSWEDGYDEGHQDGYDSGFQAGYDKCLEDS